MALSDMEELDRKVGRPVASYSLDDLRRLFLRGAPAPDMAGAQDLQQMLARSQAPAPMAPNAPMPPPEAPPMPTVTSQPLSPRRPAFDLERVMAGARGMAPQEPPVPAPAPVAQAAEAPPQAARPRMDPQRLAEILRNAYGAARPPR